MFFASHPCSKISGNRLGQFLLVTSRWSSESSPEMLLDILQSTGQPSTTKNCPALNVNGAKAEKLWFIVFIKCLKFQPTYINFFLSFPLFPTFSLLIGAPVICMPHCLIFSHSWQGLCSFFIVFLCCPSFLLGSLAILYSLNYVRLCFGMNSVINLINLILSRLTFRVLSRWGQNSLWSRASLNLTTKVKSFWGLYSIMFYVPHFLPTLTSSKWNILSPTSIPGIVCLTASLHFFPRLVSSLSHIVLAFRQRDPSAHLWNALSFCARSCSLVVCFHFPVQITEKARLFWVPLSCTVAWKLFPGHKLRQYMGVILFPFFTSCILLLICLNNHYFSSIMSGILIVSGKRVNLTPITPQHPGEVPQTLIKKLV